MFNTEIIDSKCFQIVSIIENFVNVFEISGVVKINLGTSYNSKNQNLFSLNINTDTYTFSKNLAIGGEFRRVIYDKVFWVLFNQYIDDSNIDIEKTINKDREQCYRWQMIITNKKLNNYVIVEYAIEDTNDFNWISSTFEKWDIMLKQRKIKDMKLENK